MEVTAPKGSSGDVQHFADRIIVRRGVRYGGVAMVPTSAKMKRRPKAYLTIETPVVACPVRERTRLQSRCGGPSAAPFALGLRDLQRRG
jgi:hypothetical protein